MSKVEQQRYTIHHLSYSSFLEENHEAKVASRRNESQQSRRGPSLEVMQFWGMLSTDTTLPTDSHMKSSETGYKFETLSTLPASWGETSRDYIEHREEEVVNNKAQYCSVVRTGIGKTILCLGGEVDASVSLCIHVTPETSFTNP